MKKLYLIRHAKSSRDTPGIKDKNRPLDKQGKAQIKLIGIHLARSGIVAQALYSSPAKRALDTAKGIAQRMGFPCARIKVMPLIYTSGVFRLLKMIKGFSNQVESAMVFGHNPEFFHLVNYLITNKINKFPTCGVFGIDFNVNSWRKVARKKGKLVFRALPKKNER